MSFSTLRHQSDLLCLHRNLQIPILGTADNGKSWEHCQGAYTRALEGQKWQRHWTLTRASHWLFPHWFPYSTLPAPWSRPCSSPHFPQKPMNFQEMESASVDSLPTAGIIPEDYAQPWSSFIFANHLYFLVKSSSDCWEPFVSICDWDNEIGSTWADGGLLSLERQTEVGRLKKLHRQN